MSQVAAGIDRLVKPFGENRDLLFDHMQRSALPEILANGLEQIEPGQLIPGPL